MKYHILAPRPLKSVSGWILDSLWNEPTSKSTRKKKSGYLAAPNNSSVIVWDETFEKLTLLTLLNDTLPIIYV